MLRWELRLKRLQDEVDNLLRIVEDAYWRMIRDPRYDSYADVSAASGDLSNLIATIEDMKKEEPLPPRRLSLKRLQDEVDNLLRIVERIRQKMLQDPSYKSFDDLTFVMESIDHLHTTLKDMVSV